MDKLLHVVGHGGAAAAFANALDPSRTHVSTRAVAAVAVSVGYAVTLERLQRYVPGRRYETGDVVAGGLGAIVGVWWHYRSGRLRGW